MKRQKVFLDSALTVILVFGIVGIVVLFGGIAIFGHFYGTYQCSNYNHITGKETRYAAFDTCYIKTADGWQRWDEYVRRGAASEGLRSVGK